MNKPLPIWAALPFGALCGAVLGTIVASFYLTLALKTGFANFDMLAVWRASDGHRRAHPEAFKVAFGAIGFGVIGLAGLAFGHRDNLYVDHCRPDVFANARLFWPACRDRRSNCQCRARLLGADAHLHWCAYPDGHDLGQFLDLADYGADHVAGNCPDGAGSGLVWYCDGFGR